MSQVLNINYSTVVTHKSQKHNRVNVMKKKKTIHQLTIFRSNIIYISAYWFDFTFSF